MVCSTIGLRIRARVVDAGRFVRSDVSDRLDRWMIRGVE